MIVGVYSDFRNPPAWRRGWSTHYGATLDRLCEAERLGCGSIWLSEHHLFEDGYLPQPLVMAAAVAARTSTARIGTAVFLPGLRPAIDTAEQAAVVDQLSGGRLDLGLGFGYRIPEFEIYGREVRGRYETVEERIVEIRRLWDEGICTPPPAQSRLPIWLGATGPRGARMAGRLGEGLLWLDDALLEPYREGLVAGGHDPATARMTGLVNLVLADDPDAAWARIAPHLAYQRDSYNRYGAEGRERGTMTASRTLQPGSGAVDVEALRGPARQALPPAFDVVTPAEAIRRLTAWLSPLPVEQIYLWESVAGMPDDLADRHVELVATHLAPALAGVGITT
ncbi:MAG: LLM class flavin-dependent oxidoreductase [Solirubrobacteraceae bacterium]